MKWRCGLGALERQAGFDEKWRAVGMHLIDRNRAAGGQGYALRPHGIAFIREARNAEEDIRSICRANLWGLVRICRHPFADPLHRHLFTRDEVAFDEHPADRAV